MDIYCKVLEGGQNCGRFEKRENATEYFRLPRQEIVAFAPASQQFSAHTGHWYFVTKDYADKIGLIYIEDGENEYLENYVTVHYINELNDVNYINNEHIRIGRFFRYDEKFRLRWETPKLKAFEKWLESVPEGTDDSIFEAEWELKLKR